jgi:4-hydroxy-3-polyprenylbenzoate decarboxylase
VKTWFVTIAGASGSVYGLRLIEQLLSSGDAVTLVVAKAGREAMVSEAGLALPDAPAAASASLLRFLELPETMPLEITAEDDPSDPTVSDSPRTEGMIACPASMSFCGAVSAGLAPGLPERVADFMLKERRPLVLVFRETALSLVHLRNLTALAEAGAVVIPASPAFHGKPSGIDDLVDFVVGKVLEQIGVEHHLFRGRTG